MSRDITDAVLSSLGDSVVYPFFAVELLFDGDQTLRMWTGDGTLVYKGDSWFGTGTMLGVDVVEETSELAAKGASLTLSGVPSEVISLALSEPYQGRIAKVYLGMFVQGEILLESEDYILLEDGGKISLENQHTALTEIFSGYMDTMDIEEGPSVSTIQLAIENKLIDLERPRTARYTSSYQKSKFSGDKGFDFIEDLQDKELFWGKTTA